MLEAAEIRGQAISNVEMNEKKYRIERAKGSTK
jgi:hypothetical protein